MPSSAARGWDAAAIEFMGDRDHAQAVAAKGLAHGNHFGREAIGFGLLPAAAPVPCLCDIGRLPSTVPCAFLAASAAFVVRFEINLPGS
jgi:hypothetical protein